MSVHGVLGSGGPESKARASVHGVLGSIPGDCRPFHFPLFLPQKH